MRDCNAIQLDRFELLLPELVQDRQRKVRVQKFTSPDGWRWVRADEWVLPMEPQKQEETKLAA